ncbi:WGR domain-containing protein [Acetobacter vaccinii]|uniref:WGR domain-containing protein n=1 Tax=Acetobacter vaccinii TaxID=2592655 RepID=A0A5C1YSC4_9PROT|nr:WGR domain-containing protein [Acetobacter vaccinii]QEO18981.1 WGR domain-containing protein [Acetobacter vaccinii]
MSCSAQLAMFPTSARLQRIRPDRNEWRWYALSIQPDLFGGAALVRRWGRLGTAGQMRLDLHDNEGAAANALSRLIRHRLRRGYMMMQPDQAITPAEVPASLLSRRKAGQPRP